MVLRGCIIEKSAKRKAVKSPRLKVEPGARIILPPMMITTMPVSAELISEIGTLSAA